MNRKSIRTGLCAKWMIGALALVITSASYANGNTLVGGGSTLPAFGYAGFSTSNPIYPASANSLFGAFSAQTGSPGVSYCETGDVDALNIFIDTSGYSVQNACTRSAGIYHGLGAATAGRTDLTQANYIASDLTLSQADFTDYVANHSSGSYPVQFPALAGAIGIAFNLVDSTGDTVTSSEVNFTDAQLCKIFSGEVTNWDDTELASAFTLPVGHTIAAAPINVQFRSDSTGTTLGFSSHLVNVCGSVITSGSFVTNQVFTDVVANLLPAIPSNWTASSNNLALADAIAGIANSIGYVETNNAVAVTPGLQYADVNGESPLTNFGSPLTINSGDLVYNKAVSGNGSITAISGAPSTDCIALIPPADYVVPGSGILPTGTYPIVTVSYLLGNANGNGTDLAAVRGLLASPYNATLRSSITTIGPGTGLAFFTLGRGSFTAAQVSSCLVN
jgi:phosphate transport system substrate-binding protein